MHNIASKMFEDAKNEVQKQFAKALIATVDACMDSFINTFDLPKQTVTKNDIQ